MSHVSDEDMPWNSGPMIQNLMVQLRFHEWPGLGLGGSAPVKDGLEGPAGFSYRVFDPSFLPDHQQSDWADGA